MNYGLLLMGCLAPAFFVSWLATWALRRWAPRLGLLDQPGVRKVHVTPTPLGGGIAVWLGVVTPFVGGFFILLLARQFPAVANRLPELARTHIEGIWFQAPRLAVLLGGGTLLMLLGLLDDRRGLPWQLRLGVQFAVAAICVVWQGWRLTAFIGFPAVTWFLSVMWIAALINAFNMLDNMDGLSAGVAAIAASMLAAVLLLGQDPATQQPQLFVAGLLLVLVGSLLGFLWHNRPPARIFMGDAGSYFVGFSIAVATLLATYTGYESSNRHAVLAPICVMAVPFYDMISVILIRLRAGRSPFEADKNHLSHRLVDLGLSKTQAVLTIYLLTATCGLGAVLLPRVDQVGALAVILLVLCVLALIAILETTARRTLRRSDDAPSG